MENLETISGIPIKTLSKSFPGVHQNLFKFLFRNDPIINLARIAPSKTPLKIKPEVKEESDDPPHHLAEPENLVNLGEVQIPDVKFEFENEIDTNENDNRIEPDEMIKQENTFQIPLDLSSKDLEIESPKSETESNYKDLSSPSGSEIKLDIESNLPKKRPKKKYELDKPKCDICNKLFSSIYNLKVHKLTHLKQVKDRERPFKCPEEGCEKAYLEVSKLNRHRRTYHNPEVDRIGARPFKCTEDGCGKDYLEISHLNWHRKICHNSEMENIKEFQCDKCGKKMAKYNSYMSHIKSCEPDQMCEFCPKIFNSKKELAKHRNTHTKERSYECGDCDAVFYRSESLLVHRKFHLKERAFPCKVKDCNISFTTNANLRGHMKANHEIKESKCPHCSKKYSKINALRSHINAQHKRVRNSIFKCEFEGCGESFGSPIWLQRHVNGHNGSINKSHLCSKCGKSFESFSRWNNHEMKYCKK